MRIRTLVAALGGLLMATSTVSADDEAFRSDHPDRYTVERGDTLWDISERFLESPWLWPEIWHVNPDIDNPHLIYPGDIIELVYIDGEPRLTVDRQPREVRLSPGEDRLSPQVREEKLEPAISTIPMDAIRPFLNRSRVIDEDTLRTSPYIVAGGDERVMATEGDTVYVRRMPDNPEHRTFAVVRPGGEYRDPITDERLGFEATYLGEARLERNGDPATVQLTSSNREILAEDRLIPTRTGAIRTEFQPRAPEGDVQGVIMDVMDGVSQIGQFDVVVVNRGEREGLREGDVLAVYKAGREVRDRIADEQVTLPEERAGELVVFEVFDKVSFGLVMQATRAINVMDMVREP